MKTHLNRAALAAWAAALALGACVAAPTTTPQVAPLNADQLGLTGARAPAVGQSWWNAFGDPQLDALVARAFEDSPTLAMALARIRDAQAQLAQARARTYPQVTFDANDVYTRFSENYIIPPPYGGMTQWFGTMQANLSWSLDLFGKQQAQIDKDRATVEAARLDAEAARLALAGAVTQAYIALDRAFILADVAADAVRQRRSILDLTASRVTNGLEAPAAQRLAETQAAQADIDLIHANSLKDVAIHELAALTGRGADGYNVARPKLKEAALPLPDVLPADLLARRADIAAARARIDAAAGARVLAQKAYYPDINLIGLVGTAALGLGNLFEGSSAQYGPGAAIHLPLFDARALHADFAGATARLDQSVADYNAAVTSAIREAADALSAIGGMTKTIPAVQRLRDAAEESFRLAEQGYKSGLTPQLNVLNAEDLVLQARRQQAALGSDLASAHVSLLMAVGGGFDPRALQQMSTNQDSPKGPAHE
jgi:NodT family efflux transporter outer membrane factor (OMF) lipoprotein